MPRVLLLGAEGLLGSHLRQTLKVKGDFELIPTSRTSSSDVHFDYRLRGLGGLLKRHRPDVVINCIAVTTDSSSVLNLFKINSILPIHLAMLGFKSKIRVVHISSNAVFSGKRDINLENTLPIPHSKYGLSKLLGDLAMVSSLVIRTSFVGISSDSRSRKGLLDDLLHLPRKSSFQIRENFKWNGVTAEALSEFIYTAISMKDFPTGVIHLGTDQKLDRYQLVKMILDHFGRVDVSVIMSPQESTRNLSLDSRKSELISQIWSDSRFGSNPTILQMILELPATN